MNPAANKPIQVVALLVLLATTGTVPFHRPRRELNQVDTVHVKPLASLALWSASVMLSS